jgi:hypothetical protein
MEAVCFFETSGDFYRITLLEAQLDNGNHGGIWLA